MEKKNLLFTKKNCELSNKLISLIDESFRIISIDSNKLPDELKEYEIPFIIIKNITKPIECERAISYLENKKFFYQETNNITKKIIQMKQIVDESGQSGISKEFNKISDEYTFIENNKNIENIHRSLETIDDSKKIDYTTDFNKEVKLNNVDTAKEMKQMLLNRNREMSLNLRGKR